MPKSSKIDDNGKDFQQVQVEYDLIHACFKTTAEPYDYLEWDGIKLHVVLNDMTLETYTYDDLMEIVPQFESSSILV